MKFFIILDIRFKVAKYVHFNLEYITIINECNNQ